MAGLYFDYCDARGEVGEVFQGGVVLREVCPESSAFEIRFD